MSPAFRAVGARITVNAKATIQIDFRIFLIPPLRWAFVKLMIAE
jgi:hypothetical protein